MKRTVPVIILLCIMLCGCEMLNVQMKEPVSFYYLEKEFSYGRNGSVIVPEQREAAGMRRDLSYVMALYLMGPVEEEHIMPLPPGTRIYGTVAENGDILLQLSDAAENLSDSEFTLACACLSMTCFEISDAQEVTVENGERKITMNRDSITLSDNGAEHPTVEETK